MFSIKRLSFIGRTYRHLNRYHQILRVLFKYGFGDLVGRLRIAECLECGLHMVRRGLKRRFTRLSRPERLRLAFAELGPTFIKLGQLLSTRPDLIPADFLHELAKLQDTAPPFPFAAAREIFVTELGRQPEDIFAYFSEEPLAAASMAQVHRARLHNGDEAAVKILRPGIERIIAVDLEILAHIAWLMEQHIEEARGHNPVAVVHEFARSLEQEIDCSQELANIERFAHCFVGEATVRVPTVYPELCGERILVMEHVSGIKAGDIAALRGSGYDLSLIAERGAKLVMEQIFVHGFFHADPHPGNIFILPDNVVCFVDFGQMGRLSRQERENITNLIVHVVSGNEREIVTGVLRVTNQLGEVNREALGRDLTGLIDRYLYRPLAGMKAGKIFQELIGLIARHRLSFKPEFYLMMKALSTVEGVGLMLDPNLQLIRQAKPFMRRISINRFAPNRLAEDMTYIGLAYARFFRELPEEARLILRQIRTGTMRIEFEHKGMLQLAPDLHRIANRIAFAIVLAALIVGSSLIVLSGIPPRWHNIPVLGLLGFAVSAVMGLKLFFLK
ncbi:MAG: AarF/ABC1/UbiB kinase family protein [Desulfobulbaceae bacterium]|jgi:ubiquinone biosynthesis protein|nr:AarF/ABC1/UbiB kinase family protein [Desulfobulbaceae bacterium]